MHGRRGDEPHRAVDARAGIPAALVVARVRAHGERVLACLHERRRVHAEAHVAVVPAAGQLAVHVHLRAGHHAVELQPQRAAGLHARELRVRERERAPVPAHALPRQLARAAVRLGVERAGDRPVVRHLHRLPRRVVEGDGRRVKRRRMILGELPVSAKRDDGSAAVLVATGQQCCQPQRNEHFFHAAILPQKCERRKVKGEGWLLWWL